MKTYHCNNFHKHTFCLWNEVSKVILITPDRFLKPVRCNYLEIKHLNIRLFCWIIIFLLVGCKKETEFNETDYDKKQGLVTKTKIIYKPKWINEYHIEYKLFMDSTLTLSKKYFEGDFITNENQPIVVFINKKDTSDYFIAHKGIIDNNLLFNYLKKEKIPYYIKDTKRINLKY